LPHAQQLTTVRNLPVYSVKREQFSGLSASQQARRLAPAGQTTSYADGALVPERMARNQGSQMIGEEFIQFLEIGSIAVLLVLLLQSIH